MICLNFTTVPIEAQCYGCGQNSSALKQALLEKQKPPVIISQVELDTAFAFFPDNQTCYDKPGFINNYTCSTNIVPDKKVQCAFPRGGNTCEPLHQYTNSGNTSCFDSNTISSARQWFDMYNTQNKTVQAQLFNFTLYQGTGPLLQGGVNPTVFNLGPYEKCTIGFSPSDEPFIFDPKNLSMVVSYTYNEKNYAVSSPPLTDLENDSRTWQFDGNQWTFAKQDTVTVPEFPLTIHETNNTKQSASYVNKSSLLGPIIALKTMKNAYAMGDSITILGAEGPNDMIQLSLIDPNGKIVNSIQVSSDDTGQFSSNDLKIPTNAIAGVWVINATHGTAQGTQKINVTSSQITALEIKSPLKQFKSGIKAENVKCTDGFTLVMKSEDGSPACVKPDTAQILVERGWAKEPVYDTEISPLNANISNSNFTLNYNITEGNRILGIHITNNTNTVSLAISLDTSRNGSITLVVPQIMADMIHNKGAQLVVLLDGHEVINYNETKDKIHSITVPFKQGAKQIIITSIVIM